MSQPLGRDVRVGEVLFVEDLNTRTVALELGDEWVLAAERNPSVQHFDNGIDLRHGLANLAPG
jgi:hypothetical protein